MKNAVLAVTLLFSLLGVAQAQEAFDLYAGNAPLVLPAENPAILTEPSGTVIGGTIHGATQVNCSLQNCMTENDYTGVKVQGIMPPYRAEIQTAENTIVFIPANDAPQAFLGVSDKEWILIAIIGILIVTIVIFLIFKGRTI